MAHPVQRLNVFFQVIPVREWSEEVLNEKLNLLNIPWVRGSIEVDLSVCNKLTGTFKTAHEGQVISPGEGLPGAGGDNADCKGGEW